MMIQLTFSTQGRRPIALLRSGLAPVPFAPEYSADWQDVATRKRGDEGPHWQHNGSALRRLEGVLCVATLAFLATLGAGLVLGLL
ncbi:MAG TPA: hypothetical protein VMN56_10430 [Casimicrobiaceae bacterium]|nr:hypothetical protein [Casimicrobiaceae bacterium]